MSVATLNRVYSVPAFTAAPVSARLPSPAADANASHARHKSDKAPAYRRQKRRGKPALAFVEIDRQRRYLGIYGSPKSHRAYAALIAEWESCGHLPPTDVDDLRIVELIDRYWTIAQTIYRKPDGRPTSELDLVRRALKELMAVYADLPADDYSPLKLKAVRDRMIRKGWCRKVVNDMAGRIKRMFRWATENELVRPEIHHALSAVTGLKRGRTDARESDPVVPVSEANIAAVLPHLSPQVSAIVQLQLLTGARPGEICSMRRCDIDTSDKIWAYRPSEHKTQHHGHERVILIGPKAQEIIQPFLTRNAQSPLFSPAEAEAWHRQQRFAARKTPLAYGNRAGTNRKRHPKRLPGDSYDSCAYRRAIARACDDAFPPPPELAKRTDETDTKWNSRLTNEQQQELQAWRQSHRWHPHQLRHNAATRLRAEFGIDVAQTILGHRIGSAVTEIYAAANVQRARQAIQAIG